MCVFVIISTIVIIFVAGVCDSMLPGEWVCYLVYISEIIVIGCRTVYDHDNISVT